MSPLFYILEQRKIEPEIRKGNTVHLQELYIQMEVGRIAKNTS